LKWEETMHVRRDAAVAFSMGAGSADCREGDGSQGRQKVWLAGNFHGGANQNVVGEPAQGEISLLGPAKRNRRLRKLPVRRREMCASVAEDVGARRCGIYRQQGVGGRWKGSAPTATVGGRRR
jgi:hypothetical protein